MTSEPPSTISHEQSTAERLLPDGGHTVEERLADGYLFDLPVQNSTTSRSLVLFNDITIEDPDEERVRGTTLNGKQFDVSRSDLETVQSVTTDALDTAAKAALLSRLSKAITADVQRIPPEEVTKLINEGTQDHLDTGQLLTVTQQYLERQPETIATLGQPLVAFLRETEHPVGVVVLKTITDAAKDVPDAVAALAAEIASLCEPYGAVAVEPLKIVAEVDPAGVLDAVPALAAAGKSGDRHLRQQLMYTFAKVASAHPEALLPAVDVLIEGIRHGDASVRKNALSALGRVAGQYPDAATAAIDPTVDLLDHGDDQIRGNAVGLLADVAQEHPEAIINHAETIAAGLTDSDEAVRINASKALNRAGRADPNAIAAQRSQLIAALNDSNATVRANACTLIGNANVSVPAERLRELRQNDPNERVHSQAAYALSRQQS